MAAQLDKILGFPNPLANTMIQALQDFYQKQGVTLGNVGDAIVPLSFGNDDQAGAAAHHAVALVNRSHWGRIWVSDRDRLRFLHNQTTHDFQTRQPGQGCHTVFVTSTARTLDLVSAYVKPEGVLLLVSPGQAQPLIDWMDRYIFFADQVSLTNVTDDTVAFSVVGPEADAWVDQLGWGALIGQPPTHHQTVTLEALPEVELTLAVGCGLALPGYTLIAPATAAVPLWQRLIATGVTPMGDRPWEQLRIEQGRPIPGHELTSDHNPLEAGLWEAVSFSKGCYIGQETIARLNTYQGVKQQLWGLTLDRSAPIGASITLADQKIGTLTSVVETSTGWRGLGYIRTKAGGEGLTVNIGDAIAQVIDIPFVSRDYWTGESG